MPFGGAIAIAGVAAAAIGTGVSIYGASQSAAAAQDAANYQQQVAANNVIIANRQAAAATQAGEVQVEAAQRATAQKQGAIRAAIGASGIDPNQGTPVSLQSDTAKLGTLNEMTIRNNAARTSYGYEINAGNAAGTEGVQAAAAANAATAGTISEAGAFASGASNVASKWSAYQTNFGGKQTTGS